ncbi:MAG: hypothetical protein KDE15_07645 [Erythrobacter sp.]|nr:hypothetical protein [Erythrobacter sp.]
MIRYKLFATGAALAMFAATSVQAQVVVTAMRADRSATNAYFGSGGPAAIGVTRRADYFVTPLFVSSDSRDPDLRNQELFAMLADTIQRAGAEGITLVAGQYTLSPVTEANMRELTVMGGNRPDTSRVQIYARIPLGSDSARVRDTSARIARFVAAIPAQGRSFIDLGTTALAIDDPEQYRGDVVRHIAEESTRYAGMFGSGYGVEIRGLESDLYWQQASETEVFLYIEHSFTIAPR